MFAPKFDIELTILPTCFSYEWEKEIVLGES